MAVNRHNIKVNGDNGNIPLAEYGVQLPNLDHSHSHTSFVFLWQGECFALPKVLW